MDGANVVERARLGELVSRLSSELEAAIVVVEGLVEVPLALVDASDPGESSAYAERIVAFLKQLQGSPLTLDGLFEIPDAFVHPAERCLSPSFSLGVAKLSKQRVCEVKVRDRELEIAEAPIDETESHANVSDTAGLVDLLEYLESLEPLAHGDVVVGSEVVAIGCVEQTPSEAARVVELARQRDRFFGELSGALDIGEADLPCERVECIDALRAGLRARELECTFELCQLAQPFRCCHNPLTLAQPRRVYSVAMKRIAGLVATALVFAFGWSRVSAPIRGDFEIESPRLPPESGEAVFETSVVSSGVTPSVHSASAVELVDGRIRAFWYGGTREGAQDVEIYSSVLDPTSSRWRREVSIASRAQTQRDVARYVKKLGNPVVSRDRDGTLWLFYVSVSFGGWSGSAINVRSSDDGGKSWSRARRLVTSPFLNISTLVRGPLVRYTDGTQALPVYHELLGKFGELVWLGRDARVLDKTRLSSGSSALQPVVVPLDGVRALGLMRRSGSSPPRVLAVETDDAGESWSSPAPTALANPDAAIAALRTSWGQLVVVFNDSDVDRSNLSLAVSDNDGDSWGLVHVFAPPVSTPDSQARFAYPWLLESTDGELHLLYTWNRTDIIHVRLNREWLRRNR